MRGVPKEARTCASCHARFQPTGARSKLCVPCAVTPERLRGRGEHEARGSRSYKVTDCRLCGRPETGKHAKCRAELERRRQDAIRRARGEERWQPGSRGRVPFAVLRERKEARA